jgi:hypothetical protein
MRQVRSCYKHVQASGLARQGLNYLYFFHSDSIEFGPVPRNDLYIFSLAGQTSAIRSRSVDGRNDLYGEKVGRQGLRLHVR